MRRYIGIDVGGTKVKHGVVLEDGSIVKKGMYDTRVQSLDDFLGDIIDVVNCYREEEEISGVAISMPGFIDNKRGIPLVCYTVKPTEGVNLKELLEEKLGIRVEVENDANCVALAEKFNGNAKECSDFICLTIGTGIGGGIYLNDKLIRGHGFKGGEFGFMITEGITEENSGFQIYSSSASMKGLIEKYKILKGLEKEYKVEGHEVFEAEEIEGDVKVLVENWIKTISYGIVNLASTLNPEKILIGGGVSSKDGFIDRINQGLDTIKWWKDISCTVECCKHENDAGIIGAVYNFICNK